MDGILFVVVFQIARYWVRQAGLYSSIKAPLSLVAPTVGLDMLIGPVIEMSNSFYGIEPWKKYVFFPLLFASIVELVLLSLKKCNIQFGCLKNRRRVMSALLFTFAPLLFLPTNYDSTATAICSIFAFLLVYGSLRFLPSHFQAPSLLAGLFLTLLAFQYLYEEGTKLSSGCRLQIAVFTGGLDSTPEIGCWVSSSEKYVVMKGVNGFPKIISREVIAQVKFLERK